MSQMKDYIIHFAGLATGKHEFDFEINDKFFANFEHALIQKGQIKAKVVMEKKERMLLFDIDFKGNIDVVCDRCLEDFSLPVAGKEQLIAKLGDHFEEESEDVVIIPESDNKFNIAPYLYEYISLSLPVRIIHPDDDNGNSTCNPEMLEKLKLLSQPEKEDSCWDILKNLKKE